jgi:hypothetical protein
MYMQTRDLVDPALRRLLKADGVKGGVRVSRILEGSAFTELIQPDDVLLKIGDVAIGETGYFEDKTFGKIPLSFLLNQRYGGDRLSLLVLRRGKSVTVTGTLPRFLSNRTVVRRHAFLKPEPYLIVGGLLFVELSRPYIESWGDSWRYRAPLNLVYRVDFEDVPRQDPDERIVVLSRVLADDFNRGYEDAQPQVLLSVNGQRIGGIRQLERVLATKSVLRYRREWARFTFDQGSGEVILPVDQLGPIHARIADTYGIPASASFFDPLNDLPGPIGKKGRL